MIKVRTNVRAEEAKQNAGFILFVEGRDPDGVDPTVLRELLPDKIAVKPMGPSYHIASTAMALHPHHPTYYFLIDRDHHDDTYVEDSWATFPDPDRHNLLVWRRREIENYFLIPEYLRLSEHTYVDDGTLKECIRAACQARLYLDAANRVIVGIREVLKKNWIQLFTHVDDFKSKGDALKVLKGTPEFAAHEKEVCERCDGAKLEQLLENELELLTGGRDPLEYGHGKWLEYVRGFKVFPTVVDKCFKVHNTEGQEIQGPSARAALMRELARKPMAQQPDDFQQLHRLVTDKIGLS